MDIIKNSLYFIAVGFSQPIQRKKIKALAKPFNIFSKIPTGLR
jgi:hypothetical protein